MHWGIVVVGGIALAVAMAVVVHRLDLLRQE